MFTGIIEGMGQIKAIRPQGRGQRLCVEAGFALTDTAIGDSIAVSGACLTVVHLAGRQFEADVAPETLAKTTLGTLHAGQTVNLERAVRFSDRLDGHLVTGHIDGTGIIADKQPLSNAVIIRIKLARKLSYYTVPKGSVAVDGISLTINDCDDKHIAVSVIPHTAAITTIGSRSAGDRVNIETDIIGKYVNHFLRRDTGEKEPPNPRSILDREFLARTGFL